MALKDIKWIKCCIIMTLGFAFFIKENEAGHVEYIVSRLFQNETFHYDSLVSPAFIDNKPLPVNLSLIINNVHDLDEVTGTLTLNGWLTIMWTDWRLIWNPIESGRINSTVIYLPTFHFWTPDIALENHVDSFSTSSNLIAKRTEIALNSNGKIDWTFPVTLKASCPIDHRHYPFDEHVCELRLISHEYNYSRIVLHKILMHKHHRSLKEETVSKKVINSNPVWTIIKQKSEIVHTLKKKHDDNQHGAYQYTVHLRRHSPGQKFLILMPTLLAMGLTLSTFWIPPVSGKRITIGGVAVMIFLAMLLYIGLKIPSGGRHIPSVVVFCGVSLLMAGMSLIISVIVSQMTTFSNYRPMPGILKSFLGRPRIRRLLCINFPNVQMGDDGMQLIRNTADATTEEQPQNPTPNGYPNATAITDWRLMASVTDRISFISYCIVFVALFSFSL